MTYTAFDPALPNTGSGQTRQEAYDSIRANLVALRDVIVATGLAPGFNATPSGGTAEQPGVWTFAKGTERIKVTQTWGTTGGEDGNVIKAVFEYSSDSGSNYDPMADDAGNYVVTIAFDSDGNVTGTTWGSTP